MTLYEAINVKHIPFNKRKKAYINYFVTSYGKITFEIKLQEKQYKGSSKYKFDIKKTRRWIFETVKCSLF